MTNGEMLNELRSLAQSDEKIPTSAALRLILGSLAETNRTICAIQEEQKRGQEEITAMREQYATERQEQNELIKDLLAQQNALKAQTEAIGIQIADLGKKLDSRIDEVKANPVVQVGYFVQHHPRIATTVVVIALIVANLWFIDSFRRATLISMNVPPEIVDMFTTPISTPLP